MSLLNSETPSVKTVGREDPTVVFRAKPTIANVANASVLVSTQRQRSANTETQNK